MAEYVENFQSFLDTAHEMIAANEIEQAWVLLNRLEVQYPDSPEIQTLLGDASLRAGDVEFALDFYDRAIDLDPSWSNGFSARANCLIETGEIEEAWVDVERSLELDPKNPEAEYIRAILLEFDEKFEEAENGFMLANLYDSAAFPIPFRVSAEVFDASVKSAIERLPEEFKKLMTGVQVFVKDLPDPKNCTEWQLSPLILGVFDGNNIKEHSVTNAWSQIPPRIQLFKRNIERVCNSFDQIVEEVEITLLHEVGHFFGLDEDELEKINLD